MYVVIFRAGVNKFDDAYSAMAEQMRKLAINEYGCLEFTACTEGNNEIALSYWESESQIKDWRENPEHLAAQELGKNNWYKSYTVQVVEIVREYKSG